jgi:hypothetical protein
MYDVQVSRTQFGWNNTRDTELFSDQPVDDWTKNHNFYNDFDDYFGPANTGGSTTTNGYTLVAGGAAPNATAALANGDGGILTVSQTVATANNFAVLQKQGHFVPRAGLRMFQRQLVSVDNVLGLLLSGMTNVTATPFTGGSITDGVWFSSTSAGVLSINVAVGGVVTTTACGVSLISGNYAALGWYWDGGIYAGAPNGRIVWECAPPPFPLTSGLTAPARGSIPSPANFPGATLLSFLTAVQSSSAVARSFNVDYWYALKDRVNALQTPPF